MSRGTILAHKHTLCEAFAGFFRALATERFSSVRNWLHPELEELIANQCNRLGETAFLRNLRHGLGSATQRVRLGSSVAEGARRIRTELVGPTGEQIGSVCFVLSVDGWRIYSLEVRKSSSPPRMRQAPPTAVKVAKRLPSALPTPKKRSKLPKMLAKKFFNTLYSPG